MEVQGVNGDPRTDEETLNKQEDDNNEIVPDSLPRDKEEDAIVLSEDSSPQRRMSLRPRSTPKKYLDVEEDLKEPVDPLAFSPVKSPVQKAAVTVTKSPVKVLKPVKVMRPPPELIKAPKFPVSSSTSVTVVPKMRAGVEGDVVKQKLMSSPSVTVSTVSPPKQVQRANPEPVHRSSAVAVKKPAANGSVKSDPFDALGLSDDSFIVEAPSFVVPYLIEKAADEELKKLIERLKPPVIKKSVNKDSNNTSDDDDGSSDSDSIKEDQKLKTESDNIKADKTDADKQRTKEEDDYFNGPIGRFFLDIGLSLVQEHVQGDLLRVQKRKASRGTKISDPSLSVNALTKGLEITKAKNEPHRLAIASCDRCNFKTESKLVMANHWSSPLALGSGPTLRYACHWCPLECKDFLGAVSHIEMEHGIKSLRTPELAPHQCPLCPFEDVAKSKVTRHVMSCQKRFLAERNLEPPLDWEPPAKIPRSRALRSYQNMANTMPLNAKGIHLPYHPLLPASAHSSLFGNAQAVKPKPPQMPAFPSNAAVAGSLLPKAFAGMNPALLQKAGYRQTSGAAAYTPFTVPNNHVYQALAKSFQYLQGQVPTPPPAVPVKHLAGSAVTAEKVKKSSVSMLPGVLNTSGLTIQSAPSGGPNKQQRSSSQQPSISITPLPRASPATIVPNKVATASPAVGSAAKTASQSPATPKPAVSPAATTPTPAKGVMCEICDNSIKDLEQLRHHMQWIHKVKIHPKMIHNRPPLNCQKCQCRFFTDQGLERHLLGSHGLVTSSMQEAANRGQDGGRCPICGKIHQWKLLSHVVKDHGLSLKPAHLSYKCTVCTATFTMYKLFENHVYTAHSVVARKVLDKSENSKKSGSGGGSGGGGSGSTSTSTSSGVLRINDEITIIPQTQSKGDKRSRVDIIELSDEEDQLASVPKSQVTITKVPAPSVKKRPKQDNPLD